MILKIVRMLVHKIKRQSKIPTAETHPLGYQLAQTIMGNDEFMKNNNG